MSILVYVCTQLPAELIVLPVEQIEEHRQEDADQVTPIMRALPTLPTSA
jgi:hypothetical protein